MNFPKKNHLSHSLSKIMAEKNTFSIHGSRERLNSEIGRCSPLTSDNNMGQHGECSDLIYQQCEQPLMFVFKLFLCFYYI